MHDPALIGTWAEKPESKETWTFRSEGDKAYRLIIAEENKPSAEFVVHLLKLKDQLFLDFFPSETTWEATPQNGFFRGHFVPTHTFYRVDQIAPTLVMATFDPEWIKDLMQNNPQSIAHHKMRDTDGDVSHIVLTASTEDLQKFCLKYARTKEAFGEPSKLVRRIK